MRVVRDGRTVKASVEVDPGTTRVELRIHSDRNRKIPKLSDPSPRDPGYEKARERRFHRDVLYPVVDVALQPGMDGVLELERVVVGQWLINPHYYRQDRTPLARVNVIPGGRLEHWENWFCFNDCHLEAGAFYLKCVLAAEAGEATASLELLSDAWAGRLEVWTASGDDPVLIDSADVTWPAEPRRVTTAGDLGPASLETALIGCIDYMLRSQQSKPGSPVAGSAHLFYDYDARTFRQKNWLWTLGPAIGALLEASHVPAVVAAFGADRLTRAAREMAEVTLGRQLNEPGHPADRLALCRYDFEIESDRWYESKYSPADGLFLVGWGWIPMYHATGDRRYLEASIRMVEAVGELPAPDDMVQQDFLGVEGVWKNFIMDESGFAGEGLADTYLQTRDPKHRRIAQAFMERMLKHFERPDGLWERVYIRHSKYMRPFQGQTRGMGWAMEGLTAAYRMGLGDGYRERSRKLADFLLDHQQPNGAWSFFCTDPLEKNGPEEKGTALWSVLMYRFHDMTGETKYRDAARRALRWCIEQQYFGDDPDGWGGLPASTPAAGVVYRKFFELSCLYAVGFFALALLREIRGQGLPTQQMTQADAPA